MVAHFVKKIIMPSRYDPKILPYYNHSYKTSGGLVLSTRSPPL